MSLDQEKSVPVKAGAPPLPPEEVRAPAAQVPG